MADWFKIAPWKPIPGTGQNVAIGASSVDSTAVGADTFAIRLSAGGDCHVEIGSAPTATASSMLVKASDPPLIVRCSPSNKVAVIQDASATGNLNIVEMTH